MDRRFLTVLGVSLVFALVVSSIFYQISARSGSSSSEGETEMTDLVVAVKPLSVGATVKPDDVKVVKVPTSQFPAGGMSNVEEVVDRPVISNILLDEPVHQGRLAPRGSGAGLAPVIPEGMRAVTLKVNEVVGVAGFVFPGMRVDVLVTGRPPDGSDKMTTTFMQNILVLTAGQQLESDAQGRAINARVVTLLVSPNQAELITLAEDEGRVRLVLRNGSDQKVAKTKGARQRELYGASAPKRPAYRPEPRPVARAAPLPPPPAQPDQIVVFRGTEKSVQVVRSGQGSYQ
ncbi:MAG: Flp pilus assembly protein CpaB [bacterium]|nr:Flp pilus assembly protein CpaB [bacterium]